MSRSPFMYGIVSAAACAAVVAAAAAGTAGAANAAPAPSSSGSVSPAVNGGPPKVKTAPPSSNARARASGGVVFNCQSATAALRCYGPDQMRAAYGTDKLINAGFTGKRRAVTIVDAYQSPTLRADLAAFNSVWGLPTAPLKIVAPDGLTPFDPNDANMQSWASEINLDVQWSHAMAPSAKIVLVLAKSNNDNDIQSAVKYAVDHNLGDTMSMSFGEAESCYGLNLDGSRQPGTTLAAQHAIANKARRQGMTLFASAGDSGSTQPTCNGKGNLIAASTPASDPYVTAVGGTQLFANPVTGRYQREVVWNEEKTLGFRSSGGGGFSNTYAVPWWQNRVGSLPSRGVPDVSYNAAVDGGVIVALQGSFYIFGGTSSGSPQWAGIAADIAQLNKGRLGFINPALYQIARKTPSAFHDITRGQNGDFGLGGFTAGTGWDAASGLGTPVVNTLALSLAAAR
ncbi:MAG: S53 family peptidase [Humibacillus sp.]|nr:S53 family peptidase [Humibacillus sp.]MDN5777588.1 S53 family peptidase [Humibacillus sp.]